MALTRRLRVQIFSRRLDHQHAIQVRIIGCILHCLRHEEDDCPGVRRNGDASPAEPLQSRRDLGTTKWTPDLAGETSVSAYKERYAGNSSWYSNRGICRIYC